MGAADERSNDSHGEVLFGLSDMKIDGSFFSSPWEPADESAGSETMMSSAFLVILGEMFLDVLFLVFDRQGVEFGFELDFSTLAQHGVFGF